jgi:hypothetical protein
MPYSRRLFFGRPPGRLRQPACEAAVLSVVAMRSGCPGFHDGAHDLFLRGLGGHLGDEAAFVHHVDAVAHAQQLGHFRRDHR